ncbi:BRO-N domain-containing protein [Lentilactobacillus buchneri]|uniref:BRO-N domain-containing protein n=1 Tax=Lentilactobacillus buchneri TaxID=1581 RepID=UPI001291D6B0|nr:BRO family protein [Lentilactobacillus buchneri]MQM78830.1 phage repressor protein [Lentilactobacillus buchneri]MQM88884.1 phage repressor protein [Lentilactobacillus buchneri]MQN21033.1 phage repressor protein [Lentilactobacillus buchneri]
MKIENWNNHDIRFVEVNGEWCGVAKDISDALDYRDANSMVKKLDKKYFVYAKMADMNQKYLALTEFGIYKAIFGSHKPQAEQFQEWTFNVIKQLRESTGLEGFEVFRMMDKQHQKDAMKRLRDGLKRPVRVNFIKANTVANKAVSTKYGYSKMVKKGEMTPAMLADREAVLDDTVKLMEVNDQYGLGISVSKAIYRNLQPS